ncbi:MAG: hypothetical protein SPH83_11565 [Treponema sp.]|nr:hypothetical protein [Spirochaetales bacterium]MDY6191116.1 hypothetical protein [Treponema sp.]
MNEIVQNAIEKVKTVFSSVKNKIIELYFDNKKVFFLLLSLCFIIFLCIVLLIFIPKEKKESQNSTIQNHLELSEKLLIPNGPELPKDYTFSRKTKEKWTEEEAQVWFTEPSQKDIDSLSKSNDKMINEITGAAP